MQAIYQMIGAVVAFLSQTSAQFQLLQLICRKHAVLLPFHKSWNSNVQMDISRSGTTHYMFWFKGINNFRVFLHLLNPYKTQHVNPFVCGKTVLWKHVQFSVKTRKQKCAIYVWYMYKLLKLFGLLVSKTCKTCWLFLWSYWVHSNLPLLV